MKEGISLLIQGMGSKYVRYFNRKYKRTGTLWEGRFKSSIISRDEYLLACRRYIELNPVRAGIVSQPHEYPWSSYNFKVKGIRNEFLDRDPAYEGLAETEEERWKAYRSWVKQGISELELKRIRKAVQRGGLLGDEKFKERVASEIGRRVELRPQGRPKKISLAPFSGGVKAK